MNVGPRKWPSVCAVLMSAVALFSAAPASADPNDGAFIAALAKAGIVVTDQNSAIATAHTVCAQLDQSNKSGILAMKLTKETALSLNQSGYFIGASISAYCPQYIGRTDNSARWLYPWPPFLK
jgi:hypothetical protein